ncbi:uncharacterized protein LOC142342069 [Convolutriloba macropyga]|uniref:uncharacterized protein LOC142342069 n=1 Tax=Convolutriloba macropyga TaxID=536237 RepID=UPI003F51D02E
MDDQVDRTLYVGNLVEHVTEEILFELFLQAGPLVNVVVKRPKNSNNKFAFIIYKHSQSVPYAIELFRDTRLYGRTLSIRARMESKHASPDNDTSDLTPIDLQHKVLEFITQNPEVNSDLQFPDPEPDRSSRSAYNNHHHDDEDSYDPMSNFSLHSTPSYNHHQEASQSSSGFLDNDEYDPYQPSIRDQTPPTLSRTVSNSARQSSLSTLGSYSVSSSMQRRLGGRTSEPMSEYPPVQKGRLSEQFNSYGKRRFGEEEMLPYNNRRYDDQSGSGYKQRKEMTRSYTLQNPYDREAGYGEQQDIMPRFQRSVSNQERHGRQNAYGRRQY